MSHPLILQCSPRPQGNSAYAAVLVRDIIATYNKRNREETFGGEQSGGKKSGGERFDSEKFGGKEFDGAQFTSNQVTSNQINGGPATQGKFTEKGRGGPVSGNQTASDQRADGQINEYQTARRSKDSGQSSPSSTHDTARRGGQPTPQQGIPHPVQETDSTDVTLLSLRDYTIAPCIGCGICAIPKSHQKFFLGCPLSKNDDSETVLTAIMQASSLYLISPIYHYHLPAQAKAVLDRLQPFYWMQTRKTPYPPDFIGGRHLVSILVAGQPRGEKLFAGSLLSLRYSLRSIGYSTEDSLGLRGLDAPNDLRENPEAQARIREIVLRTLTRQAKGLSGDEAP